MKAKTKLTSGETFERAGHRFRFEVERDDGMREPWKEHDGHGIVSEWTTRKKTPFSTIAASYRMNS